MDKIDYKRAKYQTVFFMGVIMTKCEFYQKKADLLYKAMLRTEGTKREIWKKHLELIIEKINKMSAKELQEKV